MGRIIGGPEANEHLRAHDHSQVGDDSSILPLTVAIGGGPLLSLLRQYEVHAGEPGFFGAAGLPGGAGGAATGGQWTRVAHGSIVAQFADASVIGLLVGHGSNAAVLNSGVLGVRVKQQAALGAAPSVIVRWQTRDGFASAGACLVVSNNDGSSTDYQLWVQVPNNFELVQWLPLYNKATTAGGWIWDTGVAYQAGVPTGVGGAANTFSVDSSNSVIPAGVILAWSGQTTTIPAGWLLCDGTAGTPDLRDRFLIGADTTNEGTSGGTVSASAALATHPTHASQGGHAHDSHTAASTGGPLGGASGSGSLAPQPTATHTHTVTALPVTHATGGAHTHDAHGAHAVMNFYRLAYIMKA